MEEEIPPSATGQQLKDNLDSVRQRIASAAAKARRPAEQIRLVAVTKYASLQSLREMVELGVPDLGESRVQQLEERALELKEAGVAGAKWHMIGHLQRNKARQCMQVAHMIHSIDSLRIAEELHHVGLADEIEVDVLLQVNASGEAKKYGLPPLAVGQIAKEISRLSSLRLRGLMTMAPYSENPEDAAPTFARTQELFGELKAMGVGDEFSILSMGMSGDFEVAIRYGANVVRVGTALFGQ